jgi:hypothetical protein
MFDESVGLSFISIFAKFIFIIEVQFVFHMYLFWKGLS